MRGQVAASTADVCRPGYFGDSHFQAACTLLRCCACLKQFVDQGKFRSDLYYRLSVCMVQAPPLRERLEDFPILVKHFVEQQAERDGKKPPKVSDAAMNLLYEYDWPENVRKAEELGMKGVLMDHKKEWLDVSDVDRIENLMELLDLLDGI